MNPLIIGNTQIRRDVAGRYCLNDLHQASGGNNRHRPSLWLSNKQTKELVAELEAGIPASVAGIPATEAVSVESEGFSKGVYALKELVYSYAMWISPTFHLHVIRSYDAAHSGERSGSGMIDTQPGLPLAATHRADVLVSAGRIFSSALRAARQMHMTPQRAMRAAFNCTRRHTGIDWVEELDAADLHHGPPALTAQQDPLEAQLTDHLATITSFEMQPLIEELNLGGQSLNPLMRRIAAIARKLDWSPHRWVDETGRWRTTWRPMVTA